MKRIFIFGLALALTAILAAGASTAERKGMIGVGVGGGAGLPLGSFKDTTGIGAKLGWRAGVGVGYFVTNDIAIGASGALGQNKAKDEKLSALQSADSNVTDAKAQLLELGAWVKYFFKMESEKIAPYVTLGLGGNSLKLKVTPDTAFADSANSNLTESEMFLGGKIGVGAMFQVSPTASIFVEGALHNYAKKDFSPINYIAAQAGVVFMFGGSGGGGGTE